MGRPGGPLTARGPARVRPEAIEPLAVFMHPCSPDQLANGPPRRDARLHTRSRVRAGG